MNYRSTRYLDYSANSLYRYSLVKCLQLLYRLQYSSHKVFFLLLSVPRNYLLPFLRYRLHYYGKNFGITT